MKRRLKDYLGLNYSTIVVPDATTDNESCYMAYHPELEGCMSHGTTPDEALQNLREVTEFYISMLLEKNLEVPLPREIGINWNIVSQIYGSETDMQVVPSVTPPVFVYVA